MKRSVLAEIVHLSCDTGAVDDTVGGDVHQLSHNERLIPYQIAFLFFLKKQDYQVIFENRKYMLMKVENILNDNAIIGSVECLNEVHEQFKVNILS